MEPPPRHGAPHTLFTRQIVMARDAYQRSKKLKIFALVAVVFVLGVVVAVYAGYRLLTGAPEKLIASIAEDAKLSLGKIQQTATRDGRTEWRLDAASARYLEAENQVQLSDLTVTFYTESGQEVQLSASDGLLNTESNDIEVSGDVKIMNEDYTLNTATLNYRHDQRIIFSKAPVVIKRRIGGHLTADALTLDLNTNLLVLKGHVKGDFQEPDGPERAVGSVETGPAQEAGPEKVIRIQADQLAADITADSAEFSGDVQIDRDATRIRADFLTLHYHRKEDGQEIGKIDESAVEKIDARGQVRIDHQDTRARAETAIYETRSQTLTLEGPETTVTRGPYSIRGIRMVLNGDANDMIVIGDAGNRVMAVIMAESDLF